MGEGSRRGVRTVIVSAICGLLVAVASTAAAQGAAPSITSVSPSSGPTTGGQSITITGSGFTGALVVAFNGTTATFVVNSDTQITATTPAGTAGTVDIIITGPGGVSAPTPADQYTYTGGGGSTPTVTSLTPTTGSSAGGTSVTITGTNLTGATAVMFGTTAATSFTVISATQIAATSPAGTGTVHVTVTTGGGTSATSASDQFTYSSPAPTVTSLTPTTGSSAGGTSVTISGTNLTGATAVMFGTTAATSYTVNSSIQITATSPAGTGTVHVTVTTGGGTSATSASDQFAYVAPPAPAPTVSSINPAYGPQNGGTVVTIVGTNFTGVSGVTFGGTPANGFQSSNATPTQMTATSPAGSGTGDVVVTAAGGRSATAPTDVFTWCGQPAVQSITPSPAQQGATVTISGSNFCGVSAVEFVASFVSRNATSFVIKNPAMMTAVVPDGFFAGNSTSERVAAAGRRTRGAIATMSTVGVSVYVVGAGGTSPSSPGGGITITAPPTVPTMGTWFMLLLVGLLGGLAYRRLSRRPARS